MNTILNEVNFTMLIDGVINNKIPGPSLKISYHDVEGNEYSIKYKSNFIVNEITPNMYSNNYTGTLCFEVITQSKTPHVLERVRRSYADFMIEHDFNKNK